MAELLIKITNATHLDPLEDRRGCYKRGYVIDVRPDGFQWARMESKAVWIAEGNLAETWHGHTALVKIPGLDPERVRDLLAMQTEDDMGQDTETMYRRRRWRLVVDSVPESIRTAIATNGEVTVTVSQVRNYLQRIRDAAVYTGI